jgi:hypothetical protein
LGERLVTIQQCNGDIGYIITSQDRRGGDYESVCSLIADSGETVLRERSVALLRSVL